MRSTTSVSSGWISRKPCRPRAPASAIAKTCFSALSSRSLAERTEYRFGDPGADLGELAHDRAFAHDFGIAPDVGGARSVDRERTEVGVTSHFFELAAEFQDLGDGQRIGRLVVLDQSRYVMVNLAMIGAVKIPVTDRIRDFFPRGIVEQQPAEYRLLSLERVRRQLECFELRIACNRGYGLGHGEVPRNLLRFDFFQTRMTTGKITPHVAIYRKKRAVASPFLNTPNAVLNE